MKSEDFESFGQAIMALSELYGKSLSQGAIALWWKALERFDFEQVSYAMQAHTQNAESGQFMPKPADLIRALEGTATDRAAVAWGKTLDAAQRVGAYSDVAFDDPAIHAAISDLGGWSKFCRTETKDLGFMQHRFCEIHRAYTGRPKFDYPRTLGGDRSSNEMFAKRGLPEPKPTLIGNPERAKIVMQSGQTAGKTQITFQHLSEPASRVLTLVTCGLTRNAA